jgi:hypothetical protein
MTSEFETTIGMFVIVTVLALVQVFIDAVRALVRRFRT